MYIKNTLLITFTLLTNVNLSASQRKNNPSRYDDSISKPFSKCSYKDFHDEFLNWFRTMNVKMKDKYDNDVLKVQPITVDLPLEYPLSEKERKEAFETFKKRRELFDDLSGPVLETAPVEIKIQKAAREKAMTNKAMDWLLSQEESK